MPNKLPSIDRTQIINPLINGMTEEQLQQFMQNCIDETRAKLNQANETVGTLDVVLNRMKASRSASALYYISKQELPTLIELRNSIQNAMQQRQPNQMLSVRFVNGINPHIQIGLVNNPNIAAPANPAVDTLEDDILASMARLFTENNDADANLLNDILEEQPAGLLAANEAAVNHGANITTDETNALEDDNLDGVARLFKAGF